MELTANAIAECQGFFRSARQNLLAGAAALYKIQNEKSWKGAYSSFGEFVEDGLGISQGFASKLLTNHKTWILKAGFSPEKLAGLDYEKLYLAGPMLETEDPEAVYEKVRTLSRSELRREHTSDDHEHEWITCCGKCWAKQDIA